MRFLQYIKCSMMYHLIIAQIDSAIIYNNRLIASIGNVIECCIQDDLWTMTAVTIIFSGIAFAVVSFRRIVRFNYISSYLILVHLTGIEPALLSEIEPKSIAYANFATGAYIFLSYYIEPKIYN